MIYTYGVSDEPLEVIRRNECDADENLSTSRFRRLWNELERQHAIIASANRLLTDCEPCHEEDCEHFDSSDPQPCSCGVGQWFIDRAKLEEALVGLPQPQPEQRK